MSRGKRYNGERKLNMKKVAAVIMAFVVMIMFVVIISTLLQDKPTTSGKSFVTAYYTIYEDNKWGVIDTKGNVIVTPSYDEMIVIPDETKPVFLCTYDVDYTNHTYQTKAINHKNEEIYTQYEKIEAFDNYDENYNVWYEKNVLKVQKEGKQGLANLDGKEILTCEYDAIETIKGVSNVFVTTKDGKKGLVDITGKIIIDNQYAEITALTNQYENGFIVTTTEGKYGVINYDKSVALEAKYDQIQAVYGNGMYVVKENGTWKIINDEGSLVEGGFDTVKEIQGNYITIQKDNQYGIIDSTGAEVVPAQYADLTYAFSNYYIAKKEANYGIIDTQNNVKVDFIYSYITYHAEADFIQAEKADSTESELLNRDFVVKVTGLIAEINTNKNYIRVRKNTEYAYYNFKLEEKKNTEILVGNTLFLSKENGKYGYVNEKGIVVVNYEYEDATEQNKYGYVAVKKDGKWGALNQKGEVIVEPTYALENNLVIDFISKWHLAEDINANYYTK